ncbi:MAG: radical SAM protein [Candidatus Aminicenantes bacterium]|nr:radical SAM protein [Candidatus Aminicenantes bacterium]
MPANKHLLLLNPWVYDFTACDFWLRPLGLLYLAAILRKYTTFQVDFLDFLDSTRVVGNPGFRPRLRADGRASFYKEEVPKPEIFRHIPRKFSRYGWPLNLAEDSLKRLPTPEAVLLTCTMTYWYPGVQAAVEVVRKIFGRVPVILGGIYASLCPEHAARESGADLVVAGPGENRIFGLLEEICGRGLLKPGVESVFFSGLDSLPTPAYDLYQDRSVACLLTSRGCPFTCSYCASRQLQPQFEPRSPDKVVSEIINLQRLGARQIAFYDDALLLNKEQHLEVILDRIIALSPGLNFHTPNGLSPRAIDYGLAVRLRQAGFSSIFLSLENADPAWLRETGPKVSPADLERALTFLEQAGYRREEISVYLLVGHPSQTREQVVDSLRLVKKLGARPRLAYYSPVPGTLDWQRLLESGQVRADFDPLLHNKLVFPYFWGRISPADLEEIKRECRGG